MKRKTAKELMNEIGWKRDQVISRRDALKQAETAYREAQWELDSAIVSLGALAEAAANRPEIVQADQETRMNIGDSGAEGGT